MPGWERKAPNPTRASGGNSTITYSSSWKRTSIPFLSLGFAMNLKHEPNWGRLQGVVELVGLELKVAAVGNDVPGLQVEARPGVIGMLCVEAVILHLLSGNDRHVDAHGAADALLVDPSRVSSAVGELDGVIGWSRGPPSMVELHFQRRLYLAPPGTR